MLDHSFKWSGGSKFITIVTAMSLLGDTRNGEEIGKIIAKVQDDLQYLRAAATKGFSEEGCPTSVDLETLDMVITRTEQGMQAVAEKVLHSTDDHITTLPAVARRSKDLNTKPDLCKPTKHRRARSDFLPDLSAGQLCLVKHMSQLVGQPAHPVTHKMLTSYYALPSKASTPTISLSDKTDPGQLLVGTTVDHLTTLPKSNRRDPLLTPPHISQSDACKGLLSLLERGLIPPAAELVLSPPPVEPHALCLHTPSKQHIPQKIAAASQLAGVKLDSAPIRPTSIQIPSVTKPHSATTSQDYAALSFQMLELPDSKSEASQLPSIVPEKKTLTYKIIIENGRLVDRTKDFIHFKLSQRGKWKQILQVLKVVVELCRCYAIPICILDSNSLASLTIEFELGLKLSKEDLLAVMINKKDVHALLSITGQRYRGQGGRAAAATKIRATYLMFKERTYYLDYRRRKWAAGILSMAWITFMGLHGIREKLKDARFAYLESHRSQLKSLRHRWTEIQGCKRTIIHMASQGYSQSVRASIPNFQIEQSLQMGRLCDIQDPNVEVIYLTPTPLGEEITDYYHQLLAMGPAGNHSKDRVHFVSPENSEYFNSHNMALSTLFLYSPLSLARIQRLFAGRESYIVSGTVSKDDLEMAYKLGVPLLGSEPDISTLYSTKAGAHRLFESAGMTTPPYKVDIFSEEQLFKSLASLVVNNPLISRWIFKLPEQVQGRGFAYCDVIKHLTCYQWLIKEAERYGSKWKKCWAQDQALKTIYSELPSILDEHAQTVDIRLYPQWLDFLKHFLQMGGLIEGVPPSDSVTPITVNLFVEPTGEVKVLSTHDQICSGKYSVWGGSVPQSSVSHSQLMDAVHQVAGACKERGILGHLSIDFLTFIEPASMCQELWCIDLDMGYSNHLGLYRLMSYVTGYEWDDVSGTLVSSSSDDSSGGAFAVLSPRLFHTNLSLLYYTIFFQMCKAHFIGYSPQVKSGTIFNLADMKHRECLGMICVQENLLKAVQTCSSNLSVIHQEISTTSMQGHSNFKVVIKELDKIIELITVNKTLHKN